MAGIKPLRLYRCGWPAAGEAGNHLRSYDEFGYYAVEDACTSTICTRRCFTCWDSITSSSRTSTPGEISVNGRRGNVATKILA
jgi:hypothetical protein